MRQFTLGKWETGVKKWENKKKNMRKCDNEKMRLWQHEKMWISENEKMREKWMNVEKILIRCEWIKYLEKFKNVKNVIKNWKKFWFKIKFEKWKSLDWSIN